MKNYDSFARILGLDPSTLPVPDDAPPIDLVPCNGNSLHLKHQDLSDVEFDNIAPILPSEPRILGAMSNRTFIDALLWCQSSGRALTELPERYGKSHDAVRKKAQRWAVAGAWDRIVCHLDDVSLSERRRAELRRLGGCYAKRGELIRRDRRRCNE